nr:hypothetical protein Iba_scaffold31026CG0010 [Ipomoea batatas]GMD55780.1 hypothetical protein Iba_chr11dCG11250 [Ipomoea batatas]
MVPARAFLSTEHGASTAVALWHGFPPRGSNSRVEWLRKPAEETHGGLFSVRQRERCWRAEHPPSVALFRSAKRQQQQTCRHSSFLQRRNNRTKFGHGKLANRAPMMS